MNEATSRARGLGAWVFRARGLGSVVVALLLFVAACGRETPPPRGDGPTAFIAPDACSDRSPSRFTCAQQVAWGKCSETWMHSSCDASCGRCFRGPLSCAAAPRGEPIPVRLRFDAELTAFPNPFEIRHGNPNHPDRDAVLVGREESSDARYVIRVVSRSTYGVDRRTIELDLVSGGILKATEMSGHDLGMTRSAFPADGGDRRLYLEKVGELRTAVARVQAGWVLPEAGFDAGPRAELIGALCYLDALMGAVTEGR